MSIGEKAFPVLEIAFYNGVYPHLYLSSVDDIQHAIGGELEPLLKSVFQGDFRPDVQLFSVAVFYLTQPEIDALPVWEPRW